MKGRMPSAIVRRFLLLRAGGTSGCDIQIGFHCQGGCGAYHRGFWGLPGAARYGSGEQVWGYCLIEVPSRAMSDDGPLAKIDGIDPRGVIYSSAIGIMGISGLEEDHER